MSKEEIIFDDFKGFMQIDPSVNPDWKETISREYLTQCRNFNIIGGELRKRPGCNLRDFVPPANADLFIVIGVVDDKIIGWDGTRSAGLPVLKSTTDSFQTISVHSTLNSGITGPPYDPSEKNFMQERMMRIFTYQGEYYMQDATALWKYNSGPGTWTGVVGLFGAVNCAVVASERIWYIDGLVTVRFTDAGTTSAPSNNFINVNAYGKRARSLIAYRDNVIVIHDDYLSVIDIAGKTPDAWSLQKLDFYIQAFPNRDAPTCQVVYNDLLYILGIDGLYVTDLSYMKKISTPIDYIFAPRAAAYRGTPGFTIGLQYIRVWDNITAWENKILCKFATNYINDTSTGSNVTVPTEFKFMVYHIDEDAWTEWTGNDTSRGQPPAGSVTELNTPSYHFVNVTTAGTNDSGVYWGSAEDPRVFHYSDDNGYAEGGNAQRCEIITKDSDGEHPNRYKRILKSYVYGKGGSNVKYSYDTDPNVLPTETLPLDSTPGAAKIPGVGEFVRTVGLHIKDDSTDDLRVTKISCEALVKQKIDQ